jgi:hypothetical protein
MNCINRIGGVSRIVSWAVALGLAASSAGCMENSERAQSAATETAKLDRHFVRQGRELVVTEAPAAQTANSDRQFRREGRELRELPVSPTIETANPDWAQTSESQNRDSAEVSSTVEAHYGR